MHLIGVLNASFMQINTLVNLVFIINSISLVQAFRFKSDGWVNNKGSFVIPIRSYYIEESRRTN